MRRKLFVQLGVFVLLGGMATGLTGRAVLAADPPPLDIPPSALTSGLGSQHIAQIDARLTYWRDQIANASDPKVVMEARTGIASDYTRNERTEYRYPFASSAAKILKPLLLEGGLKKDDKLLQFKEVTVAIALSKMPNGIMSSLNASMSVG